MIEFELMPAELEKIPESDQRKSIAVVFYNPDEFRTRAGIIIFEVEGLPDPTSLEYRFQENRIDPYGKVMTVGGFFESRGIPLPVAMEIFPEYIVPDLRTVGFKFEHDPHGSVIRIAQEMEERKLEELDWNTPLRIQWLPMDADGLQRLSNLSMSRVYAYIFNRHRDEHPKLFLTLDPL